MEQFFFVIPLLGLLSWLGHAAATLLDRGSRAFRRSLRAAALGFEPLALLVLHLSWVRTPREPERGLAEIPAYDLAVTFTILAGLAVWCLALLSEPLIQFLASRLHRKAPAAG
jgi:hypothetical protein